MSCREKLSRCQLFRAAFVCLASVFFCSVSGAHHGYADFDRCTPVTVEGRIRQIEWVNPHIVITVDAGDGEVFRVEWVALSGLRRADTWQQALGPGVRLLVTGARHRDPTQRILTLLSELTVPGGAWTWTRDRGPAAECAG